MFSRPVQKYFSYNVTLFLDFKLKVGILEAYPVREFEAENLK